MNGRISASMRGSEGRTSNVDLAEISKAIFREVDYSDERMDMVERLPELVMLDFLRSFSHEWDGIDRKALESS